MRFQAGRFAWLSLPIVLAACGPSGPQRVARELDTRLQARLASSIATGQAALQPLPAGAQVTLPPALGFQDPKGGLGEKDSFVLDSVIQGLLDPSLMRIDIADPTAAPDSAQAARLRGVMQYFVDYRLGSSLQPAGPTLGTPPGLVAAPPANLTITINVVCPRRHMWPGYGSGQSAPSCH